MMLNAHLICLSAMGWRYGNSQRSSNLTDFCQNVTEQFSTFLSSSLTNPVKRKKSYHSPSAYYPNQGEQLSQFFDTAKTFQTRANTPLTSDSCASLKEVGCLRFSHNTTAICKQNYIVNRTSTNQILAMANWASLQVSFIWVRGTLSKSHSTYIELTHSNQSKPSRISGDWKMARLLST